MKCKDHGQNRLLVEHDPKEKNINLIQALSAAAVASLGPVAALNTGLTAAGVVSLPEAVNSLQTAIAALQAAVTIN